MVKQTRSGPSLGANRWATRSRLRSSLIRTSMVAGTPGSRPKKAPATAFRSDDTEQTLPVTATLTSSLSRQIQELHDNASLSLVVTRPRGAPNPSLERTAARVGHIADRRPPAARKLAATLRSAQNATSAQLGSVRPQTPPHAPLLVILCREGPRDRKAVERRRLVPCENPGQSRSVQASVEEWARDGARAAR